MAATIAQRRPAAGILTHCIIHRHWYYPTPLVLSGDTNPCRMTGVTLHSQVHYEEIQTLTCGGTLFSSVKPHSHTMSVCLSSARAGPFRQILHTATGTAHRPLIIHRRWCAPPSPKHPEGEQILGFVCLDLYHESPDSCERQYESRACKGDLMPL